jgi:hypothetical protein
MDDLGVFTIGFFAGYFALAMIMQLDERKKNDRKE